MKKKLKKMLWLLGVVILCIITYNMLFRSTPERVFETLFDVSLDDFDYSVVSFEDEQYPNGDREINIVLKFKNLTPQNIAYLKSKQAKPLPITKELRSKVPYRFTFLKRGYYFYTQLSAKSDSDYKVLIFNLETNEAILYLTII